MLFGKKGGKKEALDSVDLMIKQYREESERYDRLEKERIRRIEQAKEDAEIKRELTKLYAERVSRESKAGMFNKSAQNIVNNFGSSQDKMKLTNPINRSGRASGYIQNIDNSNHIFMVKDTPKTTAKATVQDPTVRAANVEKTNFFRALKTKLSKFFTKGERAFSQFGEDIERQSEERGGFFKVFKSEIANMYGLQKFTEALQSTIGESIKGAFDNARDNHSKYGMSPGELMAEVSELSKTNKKGVISTHKESTDILEMFEKSGMSGKYIIENLKKDIDVTVRKDEIEAIRRNYGYEAVDDNGKLNFTLVEFLHDLKDRGKLTEQITGIISEMIASGKGSFQGIYDMVSQRDKYNRARIDYFNERDVDESLSNVLKNSSITSRIDNSKMDKFLTDYQEAFVKNQSTYVNEEFFHKMFEDLIRVGDEESDTKTEYIKNVLLTMGEEGRILSNEISRARATNDTKSMMALSTKIGALLSEQLQKSRATGSVAMEKLITSKLEFMGLDKNTIEDMSNRNVNLAGYKEVTEQIKRTKESPSILVIKDHIVLLSEKLTSLVESNGILAGILRGINSLGLGLDDLVGIFYGFKMAKAIASPFAGIAGSLFSYGLGSSDWLQSTGIAKSNGMGGFILDKKVLAKYSFNGIKGLVNNPLFKGAAGIGSLFMAMNDMQEALNKADEWGTSKGGAAVAGILAGTGSGVNGALQNALKWGAAGAMFGPVGIAIGGIAGGIAGYFGGEKIAKYMDVAGKAISRYWDDAVVIGKQLWNGLTDGIKYLIDNAGEGIKWLGSKFWDFVTFVPRKIWELINFNFGVLSTLLSDGPSAAWEVLKNGVLGFAGGIRDKLIAVKDWINEMISFKFIKDVMNGEAKQDDSDELSKTLVEKVKIKASEEDIKIVNKLVTSGVLNRTSDSKLMKSYQNAYSEEDYTQFLKDYRKTLENNTDDNSKLVVNTIDTVLKSGTKSDINKLGNSLWKKDENVLLDYLIRKDEKPIKVETTAYEKKEQERIAEKATAKGVETGAKKANLATDKDDVVGDLIVRGQLVSKGDNITSGNITLPDSSGSIGQVGLGTETKHNELTGKAVKSSYGFIGKNRVVNYTLENGEVQQKKGGTRAWRNNNPGNLEYGKYAISMGAIGSDGRFAIFPTYEMGARAKERLLFEATNAGKGSKYGTGLAYKDKTLAQAIFTYAPPGENNSDAYIKRVMKLAGVENKKMSEYTLDERGRILKAMEVVEGYKSGKVYTSNGVEVISKPEQNVIVPQTKVEQIKEDTKYIDEKEKELKIAETVNNNNTNNEIKEIRDESEMVFWLKKIASYLSRNPSSFGGM